jgi:hypothetical protein
VMERGEQPSDQARERADPVALAGQSDTFCAPVAADAQPDSGVSNGW